MALSRCAGATTAVGEDTSNSPLRSQAAGGRGQRHGQHTYAEQCVNHEFHRRARSTRAQVEPLSRECAEYWLYSIENVSVPVRQQPERALFSGGVPPEMGLLRSN